MQTTGTYTARSIPINTFGRPSWDQSDEADERQALRSINTGHDDRGWRARLWDTASEWRAKYPKIAALLLLAPSGLGLAAGGMSVVKDPDDHVTAALAFSGGGLLAIGAVVVLFCCKA